MRIYIKLLCTNNTFIKAYTDIKKKKKKQLIKKVRMVFIKFIYGNMRGLK